MEQGRRQMRVVLIEHTSVRSPVFVCGGSLFFLLSTLF